MADMGTMEMPIPDNTAPMMTGKGPYGGVEMGGMFSMLKVRADQKPGDYKDPGWYRQPQGTQAFEWKGALPEAARAGAGSAPAPAAGPGGGAEVNIRKPSGQGSHNSH
jgi:hypothetical protein